MSATWAVRASGSTSRGLVSSTVAAVAARLMTSRVMGESSVDSGVALPSWSASSPHHSNRRSSRSTDSSTLASLTSPAFTAASSFGPRSMGGPGISRSRPASSDWAALCVPNQSLTTTPSKPSSSRSTPRSSGT